MKLSFEKLPEEYLINEIPMNSFFKRYPLLQKEQSQTTKILRTKSADKILSTELKPRMKRFKSCNDVFYEILMQSHFDNDDDSKENESLSDSSDVSTIEYYFSDEDEEDDDLNSTFKIRFNIKTEFHTKLLKEKDEDEELYDSYLSENLKACYAREIRVFRDFCVIFKTLLKENHLPPFRIGHPMEKTFFYNQILYFLYLESNNYYYSIATNVSFNHFLDDISGYLQTNSKHIEKVILIFISSLIILNKVFPSEYPPTKTTLYEFDRHQLDNLFHI